MEQSALTSRHLAIHSRRRKFNILPILLILQLVFNCFLIFIIFYHNAELLKKIEGCRQDLNVIEQQIKSSNPKTTSTFSAEKDNKSPTGAKKSKSHGFAAQKQVDESTLLKRSLKATDKSYCPFRRKRLKLICPFVQKEVSKQREITENHFMNIIKKLEKDVEFLKKASNLHAQFAFKPRNPLRLINNPGKNGQPNMYSFGQWKLPRTYCPKDKPSLAFCRQFPHKPSNPDWRINYKTSEIDIKVLGYYEFSLQLTMLNSTKFPKSSCAHLVSEVSIVMQEPKRQPIKLRSEIPKAFEFTDGLRKVKLYTVSMSGIVKLYKDSKLKIAVTLKSSEGIPPGTKHLFLYEIMPNLDTMNWFNIKLVEYMEDDS